MRLPLLGERVEGTRGKGEEEMGHIVAVEKAKGEKILSKRRSLLFIASKLFFESQEERRRKCPILFRELIASCRFPL